MRRLRKHRRWSLAPALLWLLAQWTPPLAMAASGSAQPAAGEAPFSTIVICTTAGTKTIPAPAEWPGGGEPAPAPFVMGCEWCQTFGAGAVPPPPAGELPLELSLEGAAAFGGQDRFCRSVSDATGFLSRAPPA